MAGSSYLDARQPDAVQAAAIASRQQSPLAQYAAAGSAAPSPQMLADLLRGGQQTVASAAHMAPTTSGAAVGLNALSGYLGGRQQAQATAAMQGAATGQGAQAGQIDPSTLSPGAQSGLDNLRQMVGRKSDRRLKSDVRRIGALPNGLAVYSYRLEGSPLFELGCMADEVALVCPGATWLDPDDGYARVGDRTAAGQAAERLTMRDAVASGLRQSGNDLGILARTLQGDDGYNAAKIGTAFGQDAADRLSGAVARERLYGANKQAVMGGSPTGERMAVRGLTQPDMQNGLGGWWNSLYIDKPSTYLPSFLSPEALGERFLGGRYEAARDRLAPQLVKTGPEADALLRAVMEAQRRKDGLAPAQVNALTRALARTLAVGRQQAVSQ